MGVEKMRRTPEIGDDVRSFANLFVSCFVLYLAINRPLSCFFLLSTVCCVGVDEQWYCLGSQCCLKFTPDFLSTSEGAFFFYRWQLAIRRRG